MNPKVKEKNSFIHNNKKNFSPLENVRESIHYFDNWYIEGKNQASIYLFQITDEGKFLFLEIFQPVDKDRISELEYHHEVMAPGVKVLQQLTSQITW